MQSSRRGRALIEAERHSLEFTSGQLIIAICGLLLLWLAGFLMGVVAGRFDPFGSKIAELTERAGAVATSAGQADKAKATDKTAGEPARNARRAPEGRKAVPAPKPAPAAVASANTPASRKSDGPARFISDRPSAAATQTRPTVVPPAPPAPPQAEEPVAPPKPATETAKADGASKSSPDPQAVASADKPSVATLPPLEIPAAQPAADAAKGKFTIQLISYRASNKKLADSFVGRLNKEGLNVELTMSRDKRFYQVIYGSYPDRAAADKAREELIEKKPELADCRVREK
jgi:septal ring-binding cell division protein DamX